MLNPDLYKRGTIILADLVELQQALGVSFNDPSLLEQALAHSSYINENTSFALVSNERLEFLGDAVLGLVVAEKLYHDFPQFSEGEMTKLRSALVCRDTLARIARAIRLGDYLYLGKGEEASGGRDKDANLAGAIEAVIAAIYLDQGSTTTRDFILRSLNKEMEKAVSKGGEIDYKSQLQEIIQSRQQLIPTYNVVKAVGPDHNKRFTVEVRVGDTVMGRGSGKSKKVAETEAARSALKRVINFTP
jgi:ribonuclease-3